MCNPTDAAASSSPFSSSKAHRTTTITATPVRTGRMALPLSPASTSVTGSSSSSSSAASSSSSSLSPSLSIAVSPVHPEAIVVASPTRREDDNSANNSNILSPAREPPSPLLQFFSNFLPTPSSSPASLPSREQDHAGVHEDPMDSAVPSSMAAPAVPSLSSKISHKKTKKKLQQQQGLRGRGSSREDSCVDHFINDHRMILAKEDHQDHEEEQEQQEASLVVARTSSTKKEQLAAAAEPESFHQSLFAMDAMIQEMIPKQFQDEREAFANLLQHGNNSRSNVKASTALSCLSPSSSVSAGVFEEDESVAVVAGRWNETKGTPELLVNTPPASPPTLVRSNSCAAASCLPPPQQQHADHHAQSERSSTNPRMMGTSCTPLRPRSVFSQSERSVRTNTTKPSRSATTLPVVRSSSFLEGVTRWIHESTSKLQQQHHRTHSAPPSSSLSPKPKSPQAVLLTPKSSNRRACRVRAALRAERHACCRAEAARASSLDEDTAVLTPVHLKFDLTTIQGFATDTTTKTIPSARSEGGVLGTVVGLFTSSAPASPAVEERKHAAASVSSASEEEPTTRNTKSATKKSASCPDFEDETTKTHHLHDEAVEAVRRQRQQAQVQRREQRSKLTIVQRSITLAQGWNQKGLEFAGRAATAGPQNTTTTTTTNGLDDENDDQAPVLWSAALDCWNNAFEIYSSLLGDYHERVADIQNNRGIALGKLGLYDEAMLALDHAERVHTKRRIRLQKKKKNVTATTKQQTDEDTIVLGSIVSTLHNKANVYRDSHQYADALRMFAAAQTILVDSLLHHDDDEEEDATTTTTTDEDTRSSSSIRNENDLQNYQLLARVLTAMGHIYYESSSSSSMLGADERTTTSSGCWLREARDYYEDALHVYQKLLVAAKQPSVSPLRTAATMPPLSSSGSSSKEAAERLAWQQAKQQQEQQQHYIQSEIRLLQQDIEELNKCQQRYAQGSRTRLFYHRRQHAQQPRRSAVSSSPLSSTQRQRQRDQQQQQQRRASSSSSTNSMVDDGRQRQYHQQHPQRTPQQQQHQSTTALFDFVSHLRA